MKTTIILTACITPNAGAALLADVDKRREQYIDTLNWYLKNTPYDIVWADNSNETVEDKIELQYLKRVEFLTYQESSEGIQNKGFKEWNILKYVYENSTTVPKSDLLVKITGRLKCLNLVHLASLIQNNANDRKPLLYCTLNTKQTYVDTRIFFFDNSCFPYLLQIQHLMDDCYGTEEAFVSLVKKVHRIGGKVEIIPKPTQFLGVSGQFGNDYKDDLKPLKYSIILIKHYYKKIVLWNAKRKKRI